MVSVPSIDPCCPVCRPLSEVCGTCEGDDTRYPVCGSDGKTYVNVCLLRWFACANETTTTVAFEGPCASSPTPITPTVPVKIIIEDCEFVFQRLICALF